MTASIHSRVLVAGAALLLLGLLLNLLFGMRLLPGYLLAWTFLMALPLGALPLLMLQELMGGRWAESGGEPLRALLRTLPALALLFLPIVVFQSRVYPWAGSGFDPGHAAETGYLAPLFWTFRSIVYLVVWLVLARVFAQAAQDAGDADRRRKLAAGGLVLHSVIGTLAAVDWMMSLEPDWRASGYGMMIIHAQITTALAFACWRGATDAAGPQTRYDLGTMLFAAVIIWVYFAFMQYLVVWSGNLPEEIVWYLRRDDGGWLLVVWTVAFAHFVVPFFVLMSARLKRRPGVVSAMGALVLAASFLHFAWLILPAFRRDGFSLSLQDLLACFGLGALWLFAFRHGSALLRGPASWPRHA